MYGRAGFPCISERLLLCSDLGIQRDLEFLGKLFGVERAAGEIAPVYFQGWDFSQAIICFEDDFFRSLVFFDVYFAVSDPSFPQESLRVAAIRAPGGRVNR